MNSLAYLSLPLIGALIGYLTNHIAIRMLFRPLKPWRIAGVRIPLTPGVIPAARHRLARNIGKMVGDHLLTPADIRRALAEPGFQHNLRRLIETQTAAIYQARLGPPVTVVPPAFRSYFQTGIKLLRRRLLKDLHRHLDSPEFAASLSRAGDQYFNELLQRRLTVLLPADKLQRLLQSLGEQIGQLLASPAFQQGLTTYLDRKLTDLIAAGKTPADLLPPPVLKALLDRLEEQVPHLLQYLAKVLEKPEIQAKLATGLGEVLQKFSSSLGPLGAMLGSVLPPATVAAKLRAWLGARGWEAGRWLLDDEARRTMAAALRREAELFTQRPLADLLAGVSPEQLQRTRQELTRTMAELLCQPESATAVTDLLAEALTARQDQTLATVMMEFWGSEAAAKGCRFTNDELLRLLRSRRGKQMIDQLLGDLVESRLLARPLGRPADLLPRQVRQALNDYLLSHVKQLLEQEVPPLIDALKIHTIVTRKVTAWNCPAWRPCCFQSCRINSSTLIFSAPCSALLLACSTSCY